MYHGYIACGKTKDFTVMSNHPIPPKILRKNRQSLWDFTNCREFLPDFAKMIDKIQSGVL